MSRLKYFTILLPILLVAAVFSSNSESDLKLETNSTKAVPSMRGLCWVGGDSVAMHNIDQIVDVKANWISQTPFGWMEGHQSPEVKTSYERAWWGEADRGLIHTTKLAKAKGIKTMLKPHIWMRSDEGKWRSDIEMKTQAEWDTWFESYGAMMLHYAELAEATGMESLCIGTELHRTTVDQPEHWRRLIKKIRKVYSGQLTYAANWYKEFEEITFWDDLDFIGVQAYFPLSDGDMPNKKELMTSWNEHGETLKKVAAKFKKKIVFTEIGYKNTACSAKEPWTWPQHMNDVTISDEMQEMCYDALFESVWNKPWFDGMFIWKWFPTTYRYHDFETYMAARNKRRKERGWKPAPQVYFTPQHGAAQAIMKSWYELGE